MEENDTSIFRGTPMLTTTDNPYDPFKEFTPWYLYDLEKGYNSCGYLARMSYTTDRLSDEENAAELERAIDDILEHDFRGIYKKVYAS